MSGCYALRMTPVAYLETGVIYCDDNLHRLAQFPAECVDLIYLDPPFFSNRIYEVIWGDEAEVRSFEDRWEGGIQVYIDWMRERSSKSTASSSRPAPSTSTATGTRATTSR